MDSSPFLTIAEAARWLRVAPATVRRWIEAGTLPAARIGRQYRIHRDVLEAFTAVHR